MLRTSAKVILPLLIALTLNACSGNEDTGNFSEKDLGKNCKKEGQTTGIPTGTAICKKDDSGQLIWQVAAGVDLQDPNQTKIPANETKSPEVNPSENLEAKEDSNKEASWFWEDSSKSYKPIGNPPSCPNNLIADSALVDLSQVKYKSLPGQARDGEYLVNGTFRWSSEGEKYPEKTLITMPFDGYITASWQFLHSDAYMFGLNLTHPCGLMLRISKMSIPGPEIKTLVLDALGEAKELDSRENFYQPGIWIKKGTVLATNVGVAPPNKSRDLIGAQFDVAIIDLRTKNTQIPENFDFKKWEGSASPQYVFYGRCAWDYFSTSDQARIAAIALLGTNSKSDTCK